MDKTIKTQAMDAIKAALQTIPEAKTVERVPAKGTDLDVAPTPAIFFFDDVEKRSKKNRLAEGVVNVIVFAYIPLLMEGYDDANVLADLFQGRIHAVMMASPITGAPLISKCDEGTVHKDYPNDEYMVVIMNYDITYFHNAGDAFNNTDY